MREHQIVAAAESFVNAIKDTETYKDYFEQLERIKRTPELFGKVNEFRRRNYEIQNTSQVNELFDKMGAFEREYERFRENPIVDDFLKAELAFCRLMQEVNLFITEELHFE